MEPDPNPVRVSQSFYKPNCPKFKIAQSQIKLWKKQSFVVFVMWGVSRSSQLHFSLYAECSSFYMDRTLAGSPRLLPLPSASSFKVNGRTSTSCSRSSLSLGGATSCLASLKCSAATSPYYGNCFQFQSHFLMLSDYLCCFV